MKLGKETGSVINHIYSISTKNQPEVTVGMGATLLCWSDRHGATITSVSKGSKTIKGIKETFTVVGVKRDNAKVVKGSTQDGSAEYEYSPNEKSGEYFFGFIRGHWIGLYRKETKTGYSYNLVKHGEGLAVGERDEYYDPTF